MSPEPPIIAITVCRKVDRLATPDTNLLRKPSERSWRGVTHHGLESNFIRR